MDSVLGAVTCPLCGTEMTLKMERKDLTGGIFLDSLLDIEGVERCYQTEDKCPSCGARVMAALTVTAARA